MSTLQSRTSWYRLRQRRGVTAVEFALTVPILFLLLFSALGLGRMNMIRQTANNAAYEAVRTCIVPGATNGDGVAAAKDVLACISAKGYTIDVSPATITDATRSVTATVVIPYNANTWTNAVRFSTGSATATCSMAREMAVATRPSTQ